MLTTNSLCTPIICLKTHNIVVTTWYYHHTSTKHHTITLEMWKSNFQSAQFSRSVVSDSLRPHESQHARPLSITNSQSLLKLMSIELVMPSSISSSVVPFSSCPQSLPASGSFPTSQLFAWGGRNIGVSASASVLPMNTQDWSPLGWTGCISLQPKGLSRVFSNTTAQTHQFFSAQLFSQSNSHIHTWPLEKP